jgi:hypothetical protein
MPLPPVPKTGPRVSPSNQGEVRQGEGHEHTFKKEMAPTGIAVISISCRRAGLSPWPYTAAPMQMAWREKAVGFSHHRQEEKNTKVAKSCHPPLASPRPPPPPAPLIRLQRIYNFWCSMLVFTPFALCFVTLRGVFMRFPELTYWQDATVLVPYFLLFLCFRKATQEIFLELDETSSWSLIFPGSFQRSEEVKERGHRPPSH